MLTNEINSDIEKILVTQPDPPLDPDGGDYPNRADVPKKLSAFEKLIRHTMSRFSNDRVYEILKFVHNELKTREVTKKSEPHNGDLNQPSSENNSNISSSERTEPQSNQTTASTMNGNDKNTIIELKNYQQVVKFMEELSEKISPDRGTDKEKRVVKLFELINKNMEYLTDARIYFDKHIHWKLLEDYYDPEDGTEFDFAHRQNSSLIPMTSSTPTNGQTPNGKKSTGKAKSTNKSSKDGVPKDNDKLLLAKAVWGMKDVLNKWQKLVSECDLEEKAFDPDSQYELMQYGNSSHFCLLLRLIPDLFTKCYKVLDIAREWIKLAEKIYKGRLPLKTVYNREKTFQKEPSVVSLPDIPTPISPETTAKQYQHDVKVLENKIREIAIELKQKETELVKLTAEKSKLHEMDNRVEQLSSEFENADVQLELAQKEYSKCLFEREQAIDKLSEAQSGTQNHLDRVKRARELEMELSRRHSEIELLEFQRSVIQEDYLLELELRPNFLYFIGDVDSKILDIQLNMDTHASQRADLEKQLSDLKTTTNRMKEETQRFIDTEETRLSFAMSDVVTNGHATKSDLELLAQSKRNKTESSIQSGIADESYTSSDDVDLKPYMHRTSKATPLREKHSRKIVASNGQRNWYQSYSTEKSRIKTQK